MTEGFLPSELVTLRIVSLLQVSSKLRNLGGMPLGPRTAAVIPKPKNGFHPRTTAGGPPGYS